MLFATRNVMINGTIVPPNHRLPDDLNPELVKQLLAKGSAIVHDPKTMAEPAQPPAAPTGRLALGQWAFDPKSIENDSLDTLNMKILGHVERFGLAKVDPFTDEAEARVFMSLEWGK